MIDRRFPRRKPSKVRSLTVDEWPRAEQRAWAEACRPSVRLIRGGAAAHLGTVSRNDIANRYGLYLDFLARHGRLDLDCSPAQLVTPANVEQYLAELRSRVRSVTVWNSIYKLRRAAELMAPEGDFAWLAEIEKDIAAAMQSRNKNDRLVLAGRLVEAGLRLISEADASSTTKVQWARGVRNGLMVILLALHPLRIKNFATLRLGQSIKRVEGVWWLSINVRETKSHRMDERRIPDFVTAIVDRYVEVCRPILFGRRTPDAAFWVSSTRGRQFTTKNMGTLISRITRETIGVDVSPHLFRMAAASTATIASGPRSDLAAGILGHRDPRVTEEHYDRAGSLHAGDALSAIVSQYRMD
jgi:integrase